jgi:hypothetical protein
VLLPVPAPLVLADDDRVGETAAEIVANRLHARPRLHLLLAGDPLPPAMYAELRAHAAYGELPAREATLLLLNGHAGAEGIGFGVVRRLDDEPLDLAVLGFGQDGRLDAGPLAALLAARELVLVATGAARAAALRAALMDPPSAGTPASLLRAHPRLTVLCDRDAAHELTPHRGGHHVCVVLGHREPTISAEHRISHESLGRVHRAEWIARRRPTLAAILTGYTSTGGLSEAEQMRSAWRVADVPPLLEVAGRDTAGNASRSLPLVLALGDVVSVTVVTSAWHIRAPYHFAAWRNYGLEVRFAFDRRGDWRRMLAHEFRGLRTMRAERRRALADMALPRAL